MNKSTRMMGRVRKLSPKGFGFIVTDDLDSIFFLRSALIAADFQKLEVGAILEFTLVESEKGYKAANILVVQDCD